MHPSGYPTSIWAKVDYDLPDKSDTSESSDETATGSGEWMNRWKRARPYMDATAGAFWLWLLLKVFVADIDREILDAGGVEAGWLVDYRIFFFVGLIAIVTLIASRNSVIFGIGYVVFFPIILVIWKIPKTLVKTKSWITFFAVANVVTNVVTSFRYIAIGGASALFAGLFILAGDGTWLVAVGAVMLILLLAVSYARNMRFAARPSHFLKAQEGAIGRAVDSGKLPELVALNEELRSDQIERFNAAQQQQFVQSLTNGVLANRALGFWAFELDEYRRSPFSLVFNLSGYVWLFVQTLAALALINYALYEIDPTAFAYADAPSLITFVRYVLASFGGGEIAAVQAHSDLASSMSVASTLVGLIFLIGFGLTLFLTIRQGRQDEAIRATIRKIQDQGRNLEKRLQNEYEVSLDEAIQRLERLQSALIGVINYFSSRIPSDFDERMKP